MLGASPGSSAMSDFASILAAVESRAAAHSDGRPAWRRSRLSFPAPLGHAAQSPRLAIDAYASQAIRNPSHAPERAALRDAIAAARDADSLRALRRLAARALHPDRGGDGAALAECNALIDAALRTSRRTS